MQQQGLIFNAVGFVMAFLFAVSSCGHIEHHARGSEILWTVSIFLLVGVGSFINLCEGRLLKITTIAMILGYFISCFLIPLVFGGLWHWLWIINIAGEKDVEEFLHDLHLQYILAPNHTCVLQTISR